MLASARAFFATRSVLEVDVSSIGASDSVNEHIDLIPAILFGNQRCYLHSSPEYGMKKLIARGSGDIYQLSHVFRDGERGERHLPEFTMVEWYRLGFTFEQMIEETCAFVELFIGRRKRRIYSYREAFLEFAGVDYLTASVRDLQRALDIEDPPAERDDLLSLLLALRIEPHFSGEALYVLTDFPANQAALAKTRWKGEELVAERFEVFAGTLELANGYHELQDADEQRMRIQEANAKRLARGKECYPIDHEFLQALQMGLPDCCGVAVGFDRLMMLRHRTGVIQEVTCAPHTEDDDDITALK